MLAISRISNIEMHSDQWHNARIGRLFTSSNMHLLMGERGLGDTGLTYIRRKVFETLSGLSTDKIIDTDAVKHGLAYEPDNCRKFCAAKGIDFLVTQKMINGKDESEASTPDGLIIREKTADNFHYDVTTMEAKCYQFDKHMKCAECETPQDVKKADAPAYYQVLHQMMVADCLSGFLSYYHPDLPINAGGLRIIEFKKAQKIILNGKDTYPIIEDIRNMNQRKQIAMDEFNRIKTKLSNIKN